MTSGPAEHRPAGARAEATPCVSVIIPTYNREAEVPRALDSVLRQTFADYEILVCDDASTDSTCQVVRSYQQRDPRIKLLCLAENGGAGASRNLGLDAARGEYIAFLDSDDEWLPDKLDRQVAHMKARPPQVGVCFCGAEVIRDGNAARARMYCPQRSWEEGTYRKYVMGKIPFVTPTILFRRSCLLETGLMLPELRRNQDAEFLLRLFRYFGLAVVPECLVRVHLITSPSKRVYERMKAAAPFHETHAAHIRQECGWWAAARYLADIRINLVDGAWRERRWLEGCRHLARRLAVVPLLLPSDCVRLAKAAMRGVLN